MSRFELIVCATMLGASAAAAQGGALAIEDASTLERQMRFDPDGAVYRAALSRGRRLARAGDHDAAHTWFEVALRSRHDRGWAIAEMLASARARRALDDEEEHRARDELTGWRLDPSPRAAIAYELGVRAEERGRITDAATLYSMSLELRASAQVAARLRRLASEHPSDVARAFASASVLHADDDWEARCAATSECRVLRRLEADGVVYAIVAWREMSPHDVEIDGRTLFVDVLLESVALYVGQRGSWWSLYVGEVQRDWLLAGVGASIELTRFELVRAAGMDRDLVRMETRHRMIDFDGCESMWSAEDMTRFCGMDRGRAVCWAEVATLRAGGWAGGRVIFGGTREELEECGMPVGLLSASDRARLEGQHTVRPRYRVSFDGGRLHVRGLVVPAELAEPIEVTSVPALLGAVGFDCAAPSLAPSATPEQAVTAISVDPHCQLPP